MTIYFIEMEGSKAIKIGFTAAEDVQQRMRQLQTGQPSRLILLGTIPGDQEGERQLHEQFAEFRQTGEWFIGPESFRWFLRLLSEYKLPWHFARAYKMLDEWREEILAEVAAAKPQKHVGTIEQEIAWRDRQLTKQHKRLKDKDRRIVELENEIIVLQQRVDPLVEKFQNTWAALGKFREFLSVPALRTDVCR